MCNDYYFLVILWCAGSQVERKNTSFKDNVPHQEGGTSNPFFPSITIWIDQLNVVYNTHTHTHTYIYKYLPGGGGEELNIPQKPWISPPRPPNGSERTC